MFTARQTPFRVLLLNSGRGKGKGREEGQGDGSVEGIRPTIATHRGARPIESRRADGKPSLTVKAGPSVKEGETTEEWSAGKCGRMGP